MKFHDIFNSVEGNNNNNNNNINNINNNINNNNNNKIHVTLNFFIEIFYIFSSSFLVYIFLDQIGYINLQHPHHHSMWLN